MSRNLLQSGEMPLIRSGNGINVKILTNSYKERYTLSNKIVSHLFIEIVVWTLIISCGICRWKIRIFLNTVLRDVKSAPKVMLFDWQLSVYKCVVSFSGFAESQTVCRAHLILIFTIFGISRKVVNESHYNNLKITQLARKKSRKAVRKSGVQTCF